MGKILAGFVMLSLVYLPSIQAQTVLFSENWDTGTIGTQWTTFGSVSLQDISGNGTDYAIQTSSNSWENYFYSTRSFNRGGNIVANFRAWWSGNSVGAAINGPWHYARTSGSPAHPEAIVSVWLGAFGTMNFYDRGWPTAGSYQDLSPSYITAWSGANSKDNSLLIRVLLGDERGGRIEWSGDNGSTWNLEYDTRGDPTAFSHQQVWLKWGSLNDTVLIDDIVVESEDGIAATPTPRLTPQPTPVLNDIRIFSQHFTDTDGDVSPWMFVPESNIGSISSDERPGYAVIRTDATGQDVKGILPEPIRISDFPPPWEFHLGFAQARSSEMPFQKTNYAIGLNLAVTFSDPSTWPQDRNQLPPNTRTFQLFVTHLKVPQIVPSQLNYFDTAPDVYAVYGRGDLAPSINGNWKIPYIPTSVDRQGGPASFLLDFRVKLAGPTSLEIGFYGGHTGAPHPGWTNKNLNLSQFGNITGIWEIGPIISQDRWIPDTLAPALGIPSSPPILPPDPSYPQMVDYAVFFGAGVNNIEHMSDHFDVPGYQDKWWHEGSAYVETWSNPGFLTVTLNPASLDGWAMCQTNIGHNVIDLSQYDPFPGYEVEVCVITPDDAIPWNIFMSSIAIWDQDGNSVAANWSPGVQNIPGVGHVIMNTYSGPFPPPDHPTMNVRFAEPVPESILAHKPLYILFQIMDDSHIRFGFKAEKNDPWLFSIPIDTTAAFGRIGRIQGTPCINSIHTFPTNATQGPVFGYGTGNHPGFVQFLFDYVEFRFGLSENPEPSGAAGIRVY